MDITELLAFSAKQGASDLHLSAGLPPMIRVDGDVRRINLPALDHKQVHALIYDIMNDKQRKDFEEFLETDFSFEVPGVARFRVNAFNQNRGSGAVFRTIPSKVLSMEDLGMGEIFRKISDVPRGLVLVTGPTGSGKSTTLAAMLDYINSNKYHHILTVEDPIEFVHESKKCLINQREVHRHTSSFKRALRAALREDPDIVLVGEMRDLETIEIAIETAETGHLVFGTLHTNTAPSTVDRIIDQFPADRQNQIRTMLSSSLKGVVAQTLCKRKPKGRVAALEVLIVNTAVAANIREGKTHGIVSAMQMGGKLGMRLLNDSLLELVKAGHVDANEAYIKAVNKDDLMSKFGANGITVDLSATGEGGEAAAPAAKPAPSAPLPSAAASVPGLQVVQRTPINPGAVSAANAPAIPRSALPATPAHAPQQAEEPAEKLAEKPAGKSTAAPKGWVDPFEQFKRQRPG